MNHFYFSVKMLDSGCPFDPILSVFRKFGVKLQFNPKTI